MVPTTAALAEPLPLIIPIALDPTTAVCGINCLDRPWPHALSAWRSIASHAAKAAPQFGASIVWGSLACAYWPVKSDPLPKITAPGAPPILVVGTTRDPATPYRWAQALARELKSGVLLGWNSDGHTAYRMGSSCVDTIVNRYLIREAVPRSGTVCPIQRSATWRCISDGCVRSRVGGVPDCNVRM